MNTTAEWIFKSASESETQRLGVMLAKQLEPGAVIALNGNLGAGKTRLVQAIATALGVDPNEVNSPTFVLIQEYQGELPLYHFDTYRLKDTDEFLELGADDLLYADGVCLIEWADKVAEVLPRDLVQINIEHTSETARTFHFQGQGPRSVKIVTALQQKNDSPPE
ncbi:tRNA (adenosine(37)-N6)-threonylcarbamoyltransferase complex ATPase subunit type 1 TsaE [Gimesia aquarii]|uniref:tRNA (adenosine(37)-N6)-threonylcarbamoyltransferase complex ATPase subunit type 1 TsaE n=1 Tax=Gimesia aquarii TaxID=2527964 RepID=UPI0011A82B04|nr:tRNA (adenosine(37)-N6)-threonylcarbamoyltransferase complex ATPase subunit type 1 TsaE [Gimesia aquarii]